MDTPSFKPARRGLLFALLALALAIVLGFTLLFRHSLRTPKALDPAKYTEAEPQSFAFYANATTTGGALTLRGWACIEGERLTEVANWATLYDRETGAYLRLPTTMELNAEANILGGGILYDRAGFVSVTPLSKLPADLNTLELCFAYQSNGHNTLVQTGATLGEVLADG